MIFRATNLDIFRDMTASLAKKMFRNHFFYCLITGRDLLFSARYVNFALQ